jgi:hypothetical protein
MRHPKKDSHREKAAPDLPKLHIPAASLASVKYVREGKYVLF